MRVHLFGRFAVTPAVAGLSGRKAQELLAYLLLSPGRPHARERLAHVLWESEDATQPRTYLRKALWQLQRAFGRVGASGQPPAVHADAECIEIRCAPWLWVDVHEFDAAFDDAMRGGTIRRSVDRLERALAVYRGDLLEGWYLSWCEVERVRLQQRFVTLAGWMLDACVETGEVERGLGVAARVLAKERAHERTHRHVMRLLAQGGDRTSAIRQFERCREILQADLGVDPSPTTVEVLHAVRGGVRKPSPTPVSVESPVGDASGLPLLRERLERLIADIDVVVLGRKGRDEAIGRSHRPGTVRSRTVHRAGPVRRARSFRRRGT